MNRTGAGGRIYIRSFERQTVSRVTVPARLGGNLQNRRTIGA